MKDNYPKFERSDAAVFFKAMKESGGDLQVTRQFVASMRVWDKTLINESQKRKNGIEKE